MAMIHCEFPFGEPPRRRAGRPFKNANTDKMMRVLRQSADGWMYRRELARYGLPDRECRDGRAGSRGLIIAGQRGYKMSDRATRDELDAAASMLTAQAKALMKEAQHIWRFIHRRDRKMQAGNTTEGLPTTTSAAGEGGTRQKARGSGKHAGIAG